MIKADKILTEKGYLKINEIIQIFTWLYKNKTGEPPSEETLVEYARGLCREETPPIIVEEANYTFWIDRYYIAYSEGKIAHYVYWTKDFLMEEINSMRDLLQRRCKSGLGLCREIKTMAKGISSTYYLLPQYKSRLDKAKSYKRAVW